MLEAVTVAAGLVGVAALIARVVDWYEQRENCSRSRRGERDGN